MSRPAEWEASPWLHPWRSPEEYWDSLAQTAQHLITDVRDLDTGVLAAQLERAARGAPQFVAHLVVALAAMISPDDTTDTLAARVDGCLVRQVTR